MLITDKNSVTIQSISNINEILRNSAENLLMLGLATNAD